MKTIRLLTAVVFIVLCRAAFGADDAIVAKFKALEEQWSSAIKAQDRAKLEDFLRPEYTLTVAFADQLAVVDRASWLQNATTGYVIHDFRFEEISVREYGDVAVVTSRYAQKATVAGRDRSGEFFLTDVWVKTGDRWQVSARYSSRPEPVTPTPAMTPGAK